MTKELCAIVPLNPNELRRSQGDCVTCEIPPAQSFTLGMHPSAATDILNSPAAEDDDNSDARCAFNLHRLKSGTNLARRNH